MPCPNLLYSAPFNLPCAWLEGAQDAWLVIGGMLFAGGLLMRRCQPAMAGAMLMALAPMGVLVSLAYAIIYAMAAVLYFLKKAQPVLKPGPMSV